MTKLASLFMACALAAIAQPNLSGVWKSETNSDQIMKIEQRGVAIDVSVRSPGNIVTLHSVIGQETKNEIRGLPVMISARWDQGALVIQLHAAANGNEINVTDRYSLSKDGELNAEETRKVGDQPEATEKRVLSRRAAEEWQKDPGLEAAEIAYKNIQLLKGQSASELQTFMARITKALGVGCDHCHVIGKFDSDEKAPKLAARKMILMVRAIDTQNFPSSNDVTCWTCHRGSVKPESAPSPPSAPK